jgi:hypothetical protein
MGLRPGISYTVVAQMFGNVTVYVWVAGMKDAGTYGRRDLATKQILEWFPGAQELTYDQFMDLGQKEGQPWTVTAGGSYERPIALEQE